jgi:hypothetical protein
MQISKSGGIAMKNIRISLCVLLLMPLKPAQPAFAATNDSPLDIKSAANIDENLFLLRSLELTYERWPRNSLDRDYLQSWLAQTRLRTSRLRATIKDKRLDPNVGKLYDDCLQLLDTYEIYLANLGAIDRNAVKLAQEDSTKVARTAFKLSFETANEAQQRGETAPRSIGAGIVAGIVGGAIEDYQRGQARDETKRVALEAEMRRVNAAWTDAKSTAEVIVDRLTKLYGWKPGEAGFDGFTSQNMSDYLKRRPRDPFLRVANALIRGKNETPANVLADARSCLDAARQVPEGRVYDSFRTEFVAAAADLAVLAAGRELDKYAYSSGPAKSAPEAVSICKTLLAFDPGDGTGNGNMLLARALGCAGRYVEAIDVAAKAKPFHRDPYFAYRHARLMSLTGSPERSLEWFKFAIQLGYNDIAFARGDPDLQLMREKHSQAFADLIGVKWEWKIDWGIIGPDKIILTNRSPFTLTDISFDVAVSSTGFPDWRRTLTCDSIRPGGEFSWSFSGAGITSRGNDARGTGQLACAQNR